MVPAPPSQVMVDELEGLEGELPLDEEDKRSRTCTKCDRYVPHSLSFIGHISKCSAKKANLAAATPAEQRRNGLIGAAILVVLVGSCAAFVALADDPSTAPPAPTTQEATPATKPVGKRTAINAQMIDALLVGVDKACRLAESGDEAGVTTGGKCCVSGNSTIRPLDRAALRVGRYVR